MHPRRTDFHYSDTPEPHRQRTREIIKQHPEIRQLVGRNAWSFVLIVLIVTGQLTLAWLLRAQAWWAVLIAAYLVGAFATHALFVLIHEAAHQLIFRSRPLNMISSILADVSNIVPSAVSFRSYHLKHHAFQGHYGLDADLASRREARMVGNSTPGKVLWEVFFPVFQALRPLRLKEIRFMTGWTLVNMLVVFGVDALVWVYFGPMAFLYLVLSFCCSVGFHPLGARWIQEHFVVSPPQETYSYYGPLNLLALNVGFHNEHHDFPSVPWNKLPKIRESAPEWYDTLVCHRSWFRLWLRFLLDPKLSLFSRVVRSDHAEAAAQTQ